MIAIADNFQYRGTKPLDGRIMYSTVANMVAVPDSSLYDGCMAYVTATKKNYQYDSSNTVDETLGKWREYSGGGSSYTAGGGINIDENNEISTDNLQSGDIAECLYPLPTPTPDVISLGGLTDVALTDPANGETLVYNSTTQAWENGERGGGSSYTAGAGINIDANDEISTDNMQSEDMDDVLATFPGLTSKYNVYSTTEQVVGEWIDGKKIYEITLSTGSLSNATNSFDVSALNIDTFIGAKGTLKRSTGEQLLIPTIYILQSNLSNDVEVGWISLENNTLKIFNGIATLSNITSSYLTIQYTKT